MKFLPLILLFASALLANCAVAPTMQKLTSPHPSEEKYGVASSPRLVEEGKNIPKGGGKYQVGKTYTIAGKKYTPFEKDASFSETGMASWYGKQFHGRKTANGEIFDMHSLSAAHRTMPLPSYARVTNQVNGNSVIVRINDRGPFAHNRILDLSSKAADMLDIKKAGMARVKVDYIGRASTTGSDDRKLAMTLRTNGQPAPAPNGSSILVASTQPIALPKTSADEIKSPLPKERPKMLSPILEAAEAKIGLQEIGEAQEAPKPSRGLFGALRPQPLEEKPQALPVRLSLGSVY